MLWIWHCQIPSVMVSRAPLIKCRVSLTRLVDNYGFSFVSNSICKRKITFWSDSCAWIVGFSECWRWSYKASPWSSFNRSGCSSCIWQAWHCQQGIYVFSMFAFFFIWGFNVSYCDMLCFGILSLQHSVLLAYSWKSSWIELWSNLWVCDMETVQLSIMIFLNLVEALPQMAFGNSCLVCEVKLNLMHSLRRFKLIFGKPKIGGNFWGRQ